MAIIGIAVGVGLLVYALSLRGGADEVLSVGHPQGAAPGPAKRRRALRKRPSDEAPPTRPSTEDPTSEGPVGQAPGDSFTYLRIELPERTRWTRRVAGFLALLAIVVVSAATLAAAVYETGHLVNQAIEKYFAK
jgi:hypothetical protein